MRDQIIEAMARALYVSAYADAWENSQQPDYEGPEWEGEHASMGADWMDVAPDTSKEARAVAEKLATAFETFNDCPLDRLLRRALDADNAKHPSGHRQPIPPPSWEARDFGFCLAMEALGHGVSWFDDHAEFRLVFPFVTEFHIFGGHDDPGEGDVDMVRSTVRGARA